jgi:hypothetical protein
MTGEAVTRDSVLPHRVIAGLVPVIPIASGAALHSIGMAGTDPRIKSGDGHDGERWQG